MPVISGVIQAPGNTSAADALQNLPFLQGKQAEVMSSKLHGDAYTQNYRGNIFWGSTDQSGLAQSIFSNTTYVGLLLWNPQGSNKNVVPIRATNGRILATTTVCIFGHAYLRNAGSGVATAAPMTSFTAITATRGQSNNPGMAGQGNSVALLGSGAALTTGRVWGRANGFAAGTEATAVVQPPMVEEFNGNVIIPPGTMMAVFAASSAQIGTYCTGVVWEELPL